MEYNHEKNIFNEKIKYYLHKIKFAKSILWKCISFAFLMQKNAHLVNMDKLDFIKYFILANPRVNGSF